MLIYSWEDLYFWKINFKDQNKKLNKHKNADWDFFIKIQAICETEIKWDSRNRIR